MKKTIAQQIHGFFTSSLGVITAGILIGALAIWLQWQGNPPNMGLCMACFLRDIAGALGLQRTPTVQYLRPEIIGILLGAMAGALIFKEFRSRSGSAPMLRFGLGFFAMVGALVFLGCTWRMLLRLAGGDLNALIGGAGLLAGIGIGVLFIRAGFSLGRTQRMPWTVGAFLPGFMIALLALRVFNVSFQQGQALFSSLKGPGSLHAPVIFSLLAGIVVGLVAQRSRFCTIGAFRDAMLVRSAHLLKGVGGFLLAALVLNFTLGGVKLAAFSFTGEPIAHSNYLWNFLGLLLAGLAFVLAGGCPGRQLVLAGEGDGDAAAFVFGMLAGGAFAHNLALAAVPDAVNAGVMQVGGPGPFGMLAVGLGLAYCLVLGLTARQRT